MRDDAGKVTLYDYSAAYRGAAFVNAQTVNATNTDHYHSIEGTLTKRFSQRWTGQVSYFAVKNHRWIASVFTSPNDEFFPLDETWSWAGNVTGSYRMPGDFSSPDSFRPRTACTGQRTYIFRQADPDGGPAIAQNGNTTIRVEPYGAQRLSAQNILNLRGSKDLKLGGGAAAQYRRRRLQRVERGDADRGHVRDGPVIRLYQQRHPGAYRAPGRAFPVLMSSSPIFDVQFPFIGVAQ